MANNSTGGAISTEAPQRSRAWGRFQRWALALLMLAVGFLVVTLLVWGGTGEAGELPQISNPAWLQGSSLAAFVGTATPTPNPTPTLTPGQLSAQFVPQLRDALLGAQWDRALELVAIMQAVDPSGEQVRQWAFTTHMQYGQSLVEAGEEAQADLRFDQAVVLAPDDAEARLWQKTTKLYLAGRAALKAGRWDAAIERLTLAHEQMPDYSDVFALLVEGYLSKGRTAIEEEAWPVAVEALIQAHERIPDDAPSAADVKELLSTAYRGQARAAMAEGDWAAAIETLTEARGRLPKDQDVVNLLSRAYLGAGQAALAQEDWNAALETLLEAQERLPNDSDVVDLLASAYRQRGIARQNALKLRDAKTDLETALHLRPGDAEARAHLDRVNYLLSKRIVIDISEQRLYALQGEKLIYKFPVSTGLKGRDTATGSFRVLDKIPMAYSRIWKLKMPYWMGVYWVQGIENGIHALPIRPNGSVMWGGLIGQRASYGCIILRNQPAKTLYNWADIGTQVTIRR